MEAFLETYKLPRLKQGEIDFFFFLRFYFYLCDRETARERGNTAGEWEKKKQAPSGGARCGTQSWNAGITP